MKSVDFSSFDEKARSVVVRAQGEARRLQHDWIGPEHLLLGYLQEYEAGAESAGARRTLRDIRIATESLFPPGEVVSAERLLLSPQAVYALEQAPEKAMSMSQSAVKPEHILIALTSFPDSSVSRVLDACNIGPLELYVQTRASPRSGAATSLRS